MSDIKRKVYEAHLQAMQFELVQMARWLQHTGNRLMVIFEGRDTAGKGGAIDAVRMHLNPRQCRAVALPKPTEREKSQWYFQRYVSHLPAAGEIVLLDRSWYNRAGVEKVMGYATDAQVKTFLKQAPIFEKQLVEDGILLFKYWLCCDQEEQEKRFEERLHDPLKAWKLSPVDVQARAKYNDYTKAREAMLEATHTKHAPWTLVDFNDQKLGRLTLIRHLLDHLPDTRVPEEIIAFPALEETPRKEKYKLVEPLKDFKVRSE